MPRITMDIQRNSPSDTPLELTYLTGSALFLQSSEKHGDYTG